MQLYVVTRRDLTPEVQSRLLCRALMKFKCEFPDRGKLWYASPKSRAIIGLVPTEDVLRSIWQEALSKNTRASALCDSTLQRRFTVVVFEASTKTKKLVSKLLTL